MFKISEFIEQHICKKSLQEELRKLGTNVVTASIIGLFITYINNLTVVIINGILWALITGVLILIMGLYRRNNL